MTYCSLSLYLVQLRWKISKSRILTRKVVYAVYQFFADHPILRNEIQTQVMATVTAHTKIRPPSKVCGLPHRPRSSVKHAGQTHRSKTLSTHDDFSAPLRAHELTTLIQYHTAHSVYCPIIYKLLSAPNCTINFTTTF
jgi:hypothetical protein